MEELVVYALQLDPKGAQVPMAATLCGAIDRIADNGVAGFAEVNADLMGSTGLKAQVEKRHGSQVLSNPIVGDGSLAVYSAR